MPKIFVLKGGEGSGNFGHAGRPGLVGGSAPKDFSQLPYAIANRRALNAVAIPYLVRVYGENHPDRTIDAETYIANTEAHMRKILQNCDVSVRLTQSNLSKVLDDGEYRSVFETKQSAAAVYNERKNTYLKHRRDVEKDMFDIDAKQKTGRPVYGYLSTKGNVRKGEYFLDQYGDVAIVLNDAARERTTFTDGDSLDNAYTQMVWTNKANRLANDEWGNEQYEKVEFGRAMPSYIDDPKIYSSIWPTGYTDMLTFYEDIENGELSTDNMVHPDGGTYWEAQIHGGFKLADIKEVVFTGSEPDANLTKKLDGLGIAWRKE